jgi:sn-glycerol 3-phosphate transport system substrate-binding protein
MMAVREQAAVIMGRVRGWLGLAALWIGVAGTLAAAPVTLEFTIPSGATSEASRFYYQLLHEFELANPDIRLTFRPLTDWDEVVDAMASPGSAHAGVFVAEVSETLELERRGLITPLEGLLGAEPGGLKGFLSPFIPEFLGNSYCASRKFCALPLIRSTPVAYYNLDQLKEAGIAKEQLPTTWREFEAMLTKLQQRRQSPPFLFGGDWYDYLFEATVRQAGGSLYDAEHNRVTFHTPQAVEALQFWKRLKDKGLLTRARNWKSTVNSFVNGLYPVTFYSSGGMETVRAGSHFNWMADMLPRDRVYGAAAGGGNLYLTAHLSKEEGAAVLRLLHFLYTPAAQARISLASGFFPVVGAAFDDPLLKERYTKDEPFVRIRRQLNYTRPKVMSTDNLQVRKALKKAIDLCLDHNVPAGVALQQAQREVDQLLKQ